MNDSTFSKTTFADKHVLAATEAYNNQGSSKRRAQEFVKALEPLWIAYGKNSYVNLFRDFVDIEFGLESFDLGYSAHSNHVIQEFLFGYNIITKSKYYTDSFHYDAGRNDSHSRFGELFFSWMAASLFHDVGYDIEKAYEEETFRKRKNKFWNFMTKRSVTEEPVTFSETGTAGEFLEKYIFEEMGKISDGPPGSYSEFKALFKQEIQGESWVRFDHGIISALKYLTELKKLEEEPGGNYLNWEPNKQAALAMALHNIRYKNLNLRISSTDPKTLLAYLLIMSDEVQEWERERTDADSKLPEALASGKDAKRETELAGISFKPDYAYLVIDHKLKDPYQKGVLEDYLFEKIVLQKKHFPIEVKFPLRENVETMRSSPEEGYVRIPKTMLPFLSFVTINPYTIASYPLLRRMEKVNKIGNTVTEKRLLFPSEPRTYQIYVDHRIDGEPFLVTVFPF